MSKKGKKSKSKSWVEIFEGERKDWGAINPVTRIIPDKTKYNRKKKHKKKEEEE